MQETLFYLEGSRQILVLFAEAKLDEGKHVHAIEDPLYKTQIRYQTGHVRNENQYDRNKYLKRIRNATFKEL